MVATPTIWRPETQVNTRDVSYLPDVGILGLPDGGYLVVWTDASRPDPTRLAVVGQRYDALGTRVGGELPIALFPNGIQHGAAITALPDGGAAVVFRHFGPGSGSDDIYM